MSSFSSLSYLLAPRSSLVSMLGRAKQNYQDCPCCFQDIAVASAVWCLLFPFHSHSAPSAVLCASHGRGNMITRRQMGSPSGALISFPFIGDRCWNEFCANGNSWTTRVKFKYLAEGNYHTVKVPDSGSGALLKTFVWFVAWHFIFCTSSIKCG